uniref:DUF5668 domain-containing protein n=1 Tax=Thermoanaerobaculum aquaticum TaxID=1312852 RepID=A0A7C2SGA3_9BACT
MAKRGSSRLFLGLVLAAIGAALLLARMHVVSQGPAVLLAIGGALALYGVFARTFGPLVPGCILLGLGSGMLLGDRGVEGFGVVRWQLLGLGGGFILLFLLALVLGLGLRWWPLVVGGVLAGVAVLPQIKGLVDPQVVVAFRTYWPVLLIAAGLYLVVRDITR